MPAGLLRLPGEPDFTAIDVTHHLVPPGTTAVVVSAGGGGWGDPLERDPERVREDVVEGYVSLEAAQSRYGVVLDPTTGAVDELATRRCRARMRAARRGVPPGSDAHGTDPGRTR